MNYMMFDIIMLLHLPQWYTDQFLKTKQYIFCLFKNVPLKHRKKWSQFKMFEFQLVGSKKNKQNNPEYVCNDKNHAYICECGSSATLSLTSRGKHWLDRPENHNIKATKTSDYVK